MTGASDSYTLVHLEDTLHLGTHPTGHARYDFPFEQFFPCRHPYHRDVLVRAVARMGAANDYEQRYRDLLADKIQLIHTPEEYRRTSELPCWYPLLRDLTPRSVVFDRRPTAAGVEQHFAWPVFMKGARQTSRHQRHLAIIDSSHALERAMDAWAADDILWWQSVVCREFVPLRLVGEQSALAMPRAFEFRSFWWKNQCVGIGPYWMDEHYDLTDAERQAALDIAAEAARRIDVTFLVVDVAQNQDGVWIVIECNDGQDSGYAGVRPFLLWRKILDVERATT
jgi:hypothetical protein